MLYTHDRIDDVVDDVVNDIKGTAAVLFWVLLVGVSLVFMIVLGIILVVCQARI